MNKLLHIKTDCPRNNACRENCEKWLNMFSSWEDFVDTLYMQDFVYCEENLNKKYQFGKDYKNYYEVIPFWDKHGWDEEKGRCLPESEEDKNDVFKTMADMINNRSKRIVNVLKDISNKR